jgi:hypothetical protein
MASTQLNEGLIRREVKRLFGEISAKRGDLCENPVTGGDFVYGLDPLSYQKKIAYRALLAREYFALDAPADAPPLPINDCDRRYVKMSGVPLNYLAAEYALSMVPKKYDVKGYPPFAEYVSGVLWEHDNVGGTSELPFTQEQLVELKRRFPPRKLEGLERFGFPTQRKSHPKKKRRAA